MPVSDTPPVTKAHETLWFESEVLDHINGSICDKEWGVKATYCAKRVVFPYRKQEYKSEKKEWQW